MDSQRDLRIGIWFSKLSESFSNLKSLIKQHEVFVSGDFEYFIDNYDNLLPDDVYRAFRNLNDVLVLTANLPYLTHSDISFAKRPTDVDSPEDKIIDISPLRSFSPYSSPKYELNEEGFADSVMGVAIVFIVLTTQIFKTKGLEDIKSYISGIMDRLKVHNQKIKFVLVNHGIKDLLMTNQGNLPRSSKGTQKDNQSLTSTINELGTYLLVYHNIDTFETDDNGDLANIVSLSAKSLRASYSRRKITKFKSKNNQKANDEPELIKKIWMSQLLQVPNIGKSEATELMKKYGKPYEMIESLKKSEGNFYYDLKNIEVHGKKRKTLGKITTKRLATLYSKSMLPDQIL